MVITAVNQCLCESGKGKQIKYNKMKKIEKKRFKLWFASVASFQQTNADGFIRMRFSSKKKLEPDTN